MGRGVTRELLKESIRSFVNLLFWFLVQVGRLGWKWFGGDGGGV